MKSSTINFNTTEYPELCPKLVNYKAWKYYLTDKEDKWIKQLRELYMESSLHSNIINILNEMVYGTGLVAGVPLDEKIIKSLGYNKILNNLIFDYCLYGGAYMFIKWNDLHTKVVEIDHIPFDHIRLNDVDEDADDIDVYLQCTNWKRWKQREIVPLVKFNVDPKSDHRQIYPVKYNDLFVYPTPYYQGVIRNVQEDIEISKYYLNLINTGLSPNKMIVIPGNMEDADKEELEYILKNNYSGSNGFKNIVMYPESSDFKPEIVSFNNEDLSVKYQRREEMLRGNIISGHGIPNKILVGEATPGQLGGSQEFENSYEIWKRRRVYPFRNVMIELFEDVNEYLLNPLSQIVIDDLEFEFDQKNLDGEEKIN